jgi:antitoxin component YwqK of YwqJK toxin-antitoxin module
MQLVINIQNESLVNKIIQILEVFKNDGVKIVKKDTSSANREKEYTDEYLKENWREMVMTSGDNPDYYKSEEYYEDRGNYLLEKYK